MVITWRNVAQTDYRLHDRKLLILGAHGLLATDSRDRNPAGLGKRPNIDLKVVGRLQWIRGDDFEIMPHSERQ
jgi:hypothetical protein